MTVIVAWKGADYKFHMLADNRTLDDAVEGRIWNCDDKIKRFSDLGLGGGMLLGGAGQAYPVCKVMRCQNSTDVLPTIYRLEEEAKSEFLLVTKGGIKVAGPGYDMKIDAPFVCIGTGSHFVEGFLQACTGAWHNKDAEAVREEDVRLAIQACSQMLASVGSPGKTLTL